MVVASLNSVLSRLQTLIGFLEILETWTSSQISRFPFLEILETPAMFTSQPPVPEVLRTKELLSSKEP